MSFATKLITNYANVWFYLRLDLLTTVFTTYIRQLVRTDGKKLEPTDFVDPLVEGWITVIKFNTLIHLNRTSKLTLFDIPPPIKRASSAVTKQISKLEMALLTCIGPLGYGIATAFPLPTYVVTEKGEHCTFVVLEDELYYKLDDQEPERMPHIGVPIKLPTEADFAAYQRITSWIAKAHHCVVPHNSDANIPVERGQVAQLICCATDCEWAWTADATITDSAMFERGVAFGFGLDLVDTSPFRSNMGSCMNRQKTSRSNAIWVMCLANSSRDE